MKLKQDRILYEENWRQQIEGENMRMKRREEVEELKRQLKLAVPLFSVGILQYILQTISVIFVGHLGTLPLGGATMATSFASVTGFNLLVGLASTQHFFPYLICIKHNKRVMYYY